MTAGTKAICRQRTTAATMATTKDGGVGRKVWLNAAICVLCATCATAASFHGTFAPHHPTSTFPIVGSSESKCFRRPFDRRRRWRGEAIGLDDQLFLRTVSPSSRRASPVGGDGDAGEPNNDTDRSESPPEGSERRGTPRKVVDEETGIEYDRKHERSLRERRAREKIDRILAGPNPPFEREEELNKLVGGIPPPPSSSLDSSSSSSSSSEIESEVRSAKIESEMFDAVSRQEFAVAASLKDELSKLHLDDCGSVLQANSAYYRAFSAKDYGAMSKLWLKDGSVCCVHPSRPPLVGAKSVLESWRKMFESDESNFRKCWTEPSNVRLLSVRGSTALVNCDEEVYVRRWTRGKRRKTESINKLTATNVFRKVGGRWHLVHHHASWHPDSQAAKAAMGGHNKGGEVLGDDAGPNLLGEGRSAGEAGIGSDGVLGLSGLLGGGGAASTGASSASPGVRRIFMGSLSDLLGSGLTDAAADGGSARSSSSSSGSSDDIESPTVIRFTSSSSSDDNDDEEEDDDEDEDEAVSALKGWAKDKGDDEGDDDVGRRGKREARGGSSSQSDSAPSHPSSSSSIPKDALRQSCISALRNMCKQGSISPNQKRVLLTDIIACSAKGEFSLVEVAYELLCGEGDESDAETAMEEFADQCRTFAEGKLSDRGGYPSAIRS